MDLRVEVALPAKRYKSFVKAVNGVDMSQNGGYALLGEFLHRSQEQMGDEVYGPSTITVSEEQLSGVPDGQPIVIGITEYGDDDLTKTWARTAVIATYHSAVRAEYTQSHNTAIRKLSGPIGPVSEMLWLRTLASSKENAYYQAAEVLDNRDGDWRRKTIATLMDTSKMADLKLYPKETIRVDDRTVKAPTGYVFLLDVSGLVLMGTEKGGKKRIVTMDELIEEPYDLEEDVVWMLGQQAAKLAALSMSYKLVAQAKNNNQKGDKS